LDKELKSEFRDAQVVTKMVRWTKMYQAINFLKSLPQEKILSDMELRAFYYELKAIFEKTERKF
jgi:hypothetical protein